MTSKRHTRVLEPKSVRARARVEFAALGVGTAFIVVGILGFIPGVTEHWHGTGGMGFSGLHSHAELFHVFRVSVFHNGLHLLLGLVGLVCAFTPLTAELYLLAGGVAYLALSIFGFVIDRDTSANFVPVNSADNWLHLGLAAGMIVLGLVLPRRRAHDEEAADAESGEHTGSKSA
jgi:hypothetical protein